jgi:hypothetical protein
MTEVTQTCFTVTHGYQATVTYFLTSGSQAVKQVYVSSVIAGVVVFFRKYVTVA